MEPTPNVIQPQPAPETWIVQGATTQAGPKVIVQICAVSGTHVSFIDPEMAIKIGQQLIQAGRQAKSGLILPNNTQHSIQELFNDAIREDKAKDKDPEVPE